MSIHTRFAVTAALLLMAATWASSASAKFIEGRFYLTESVLATSTEPGNTYVGHYTTVEFDDSSSMAGDVVALADIYVADLFGGFFFLDFMGTANAVLGSRDTVVALSGEAMTMQANPMQMAMLSLGQPLGNPSDATFGASIMSSLGGQVIHGHQSIPEPTIFALLGGGLLAMGTVGTRRRKSR